MSNAAEQAWLVALRAKLRGLNFTDANLATFLDDFPDEITRKKFLNDDLDPAVWKRFNELTGPTKEWIRKSVALQERIKAKIADGTFTNADVDKLKSYYSSGAGCFNLHGSYHASPNTLESFLLRQIPNSTPVVSTCTGCISVLPGLSPSCFWVLPPKRRRERQAKNSKTGFHPLPFCFKIASVFSMPHPFFDGCTIAEASGEFHSPKSKLIHKLNHGWL